MVVAMSGFDPEFELEIEDTSGSVIAGTTRRSSRLRANPKENLIPMRDKGHEVPAVRQPAKRAAPKSHAQGKGTTKAPKRSHSNRSIYNFFNSTTQAQGSQGENSGSTALGGQYSPGDDEIRDDPPNDGISQHSSNRIYHADATDKSLNLTERPIFKEISDGVNRAFTSFDKEPGHVEDIRHSRSALGDYTGVWADIYPPENLDELAVHKRKVSDVHKWLDNVLKGLERKLSDLRDLPQRED